MASREFGDHIYRENNSYDCVVIGAGIEGSATAYNLIKNGCKTLLLEQFALPHTRGSSHGQSRITRYAYPQKHYAKMMEEAFPMWAELEKETNTTLFRNTGLLIMQRPPYNVYNERLQIVKSIGKPFEELTTQDVRQRYPGMNLQPDYKVFIDLSAGTLRADKGLKCFQDEFKRRGGVIHDEEKVTRIIPGTEVTIHTNKGVYYAKSIVLTPGPWASKLLKPLGLNPPLKPLRINVLYWKTKTDYTSFPCLVDDSDGSKHVYGLGVHEYDNMFKLCYHYGSVVDPDARDQGLTDGPHKDIELVRDYIRHNFPGLEDKPAIVETCMYTNTPDGEIILDTHPLYPNIVIGCGFSGHGFKLAPVVGKILGSLARGETTSHDISPLTIQRFPNVLQINSNL